MQTPPVAPIGPQGMPIPAPGQPPFIPPPGANPPYPPFMPGVPVPPMGAVPPGFPMPPPMQAPDIQIEQQRALLQQLMSLTPDQIEKLPHDQRQQVQQLRQLMSAQQGGNRY